MAIAFPGLPLFAAAAIALVLLLVVGSLPLNGWSPPQGPSHSFFFPLHVSVSSLLLFFSSCPRPRLLHDHDFLSPSTSTSSLASLRCVPVPLACLWLHAATSHSPLVTSSSRFLCPQPRAVISPIKVTKGLHFLSSLLSSS
ncbi:hypothetical protein B0J11DRAFT_16792 [Dendryphion nanum]|uniref:Uncharacterized protein n=1 Tax=Dendryphion nanum TaxID=256645 RepID=A0A9P9J208_9PLEO|nr:hypothetical protein B0J11DRAFT_16792 [Dendryphion nanum]